MGIIRSLDRPTTPQELRQAICHLLNDFFGSHATIDRQGVNHIAYRDERYDIDGAEPLWVDIVVIDADRHPRAGKTYRQWTDDAPAADHGAMRAEAKAKAEAS